MSGHEVTIDKASRVVGGYWVRVEGEGIDHAETLWGARRLGRRMARSAAEREQFPLTYTPEPRWRSEDAPLGILFLIAAAVFVFALYMAAMS